MTFLMIFTKVQSIPNPTLQEIFTEEFLAPLNEESSERFDREILLDLEKLFDVKQLLDVGCGKAKWAASLTYLGVDIVEAIVDYNRKQGVACACLDITREGLRRKI